MSDESDNTVEVWKPIQDFPAYSVSSFGRVRRDTIGGRGQLPKVLKPSLLAHGYMAHTLHNKNGYKRRYVARLVAQAFLDRSQDRNEVNHKNGIKTDNRLENLEWVTHRENIAHSFTLGRKMFHGEAHHNAKLTDAIIVEIRRLAEAGTTHRVIAARFGISHSVVSYIRHRRVWRHVA